MGLVRKVDCKTPYYIPYHFKGSDFLHYFYYENEIVLFKAYYQLKKLNGNIRPLYPVICDIYE